MRQQRRDRRAHGGRVERSLRRVEDERVGIAALSRELLLEQINHLLGLGPGQAEHGHVIRPDGMGHDRRQDRYGHPRHDDTAAMSDAPAGETKHDYTNRR